MQIQYDHLLGKPFELGKQDCAKLLRDLYQDNFGISIRDYARPADWSADDNDILGTVYARESFTKLFNWKLNELRPGDVLCMAVGSGVANHVAVYLGGNQIVHHVTGQLSRVEMLRPFWLHSTMYVLRHPEVPDLRVELPTTTLKDLADARNRLDA